KSSDQLMSTIKEEVYGFISTQGQYDDITLVVMEVTGTATFNAGLKVAGVLNMF
ncbi:MAG: hypothetical protein HY920_07005, partial [Elusimicrobia bacterium]|nr:hypothetical protein [Elusimicrobiota bacterium]